MHGVSDVVCQGVRQRQAARPGELWRPQDDQGRDFRRNERVLLHQGEPIRHRAGRNFTADDIALVRPGGRHRAEIVKKLFPPSRPWARPSPRMEGLHGHRDLRVQGHILRPARGQHRPRSHHPVPDGLRGPRLFSQCRDHVALPDSIPADPGKAITALRSSAPSTRSRTTILRSIRTIPGGRFARIADTVSRAPSSSARSRSWPPASGS